MTALSLQNRLKGFHPLVQAGAIFVFFLLFIASAFAGQASLAWNANTDPAVAGYMVSYGQASGTYTSKIDAGKQVTSTVPGLLEGKTYYYVVTAYDLARTESGYSNQASSSVPYSTPVTSFSASPTSGVAPLAETFTSTSSGTITAYSWNFGDGTSSAAANPSHSYAATGTYSVSLTVTGPGGTNTQTKTGLIVVSSVPPVAPVAGFSASTQSGVAPLSVSFSNSSTGNITSYSWTFGDGASSTVAVPTHSYTVPGTYTVSLTVTGPGGANTQTKAGSIVVSAAAPAAPVAGFAAATQSGSAPLAVSFSNSSTGNITAYAWNFGDGTSSTAALPAHSYALAGNYSVSLTVTGSGGSNTMTRSGYITASAVATGATSLWASTVVPSTPSAYDPSSVELGVKFQSDISGKIKGIRFYKGSSNTGTHTGSLWSSTGTLLGQATFTAETASGWQQVTFATPIAITAKTVYVASYHSSSGYYAFASGFFATKGIDNAPLHALAGTNGVYKYGTSAGFPNASYQSSNYWVDVVFAAN
jgi:PKD repeat protein